VSDGTFVSAKRMTGHVRISQGATLVTDIAVDTGQSIKTLDGYDLSGRVSSQKDSPPNLDRYIMPGESYDVVIQLNPPPPAEASVKLVWYQPVRDTRR
jgi:hypothetical protein